MAKLVLVIPIKPSALGDTGEGENLPSLSGSTASACSDRDFGLVIGKTLNDYDREIMLKNPWIPPKGYKYPRSSSRNLCFQSKWMEIYPWIVYSLKCDGVFLQILCFVFKRYCGKRRSSESTAVSKSTDEQLKKLWNFFKSTITQGTICLVRKELRTFCKW